MFAAMLAVAELETHVVTHELQGARHLLARQRPIAKQVVQIIASVLQKHPDGLAFGFADDSGIRVAAADVCETADGRHHFVKYIGALPSDCERANPARTASLNRPH